MHGIWKSGSSDVFFRSGVTTTDLKVDGKVPLSSDWLTTDVMVGESKVTFFLTSGVGSGSRSQLLPAHDMMSLVTSWMLTGWKLHREQVTDGDLMSGSDESY